MFFTQGSAINGLVIYVAHTLDFLDRTPEAMTLLGRVDFTETQVQEGRTCYQQLESTLHEIQEAKRAQKAATERVNTEKQAIHRRHQIHVQTARRTDGQLPPALLLGASTRNYGKWLMIVLTFYDTILNNLTYLAQMEAAGITADELGEVKGMITSLIARKTEQTQFQLALRTAQSNAKQQKKALKLWKSDLLAAARLAFRKRPELLKAMKPLRPTTGERVSGNQDEATVRKSVAAQSEAES